MMPVRSPHATLRNRPDKDCLESLVLSDLLDEDWLRSLVSHTLKSYTPGGPVMGVSDEGWAGVRRQLTARNLVIFTELRQVLQRFKKDGLEVIILKGAALAERVYPHLGLRFFGDIDLLIDVADLPRMVQALLQMGFSPLSPQFSPGSEVFQTSLHYVKQTEVPIAIEPHWALGRAHPYAGRVKVKDLWERAVPVKIAGVDALTLCPEDFLLHLCLHLVQHSQNLWLVSACDIAALLRYYEHQFDWQGFVKRVWEYQVCLPVRYSLGQVRDLFRSAIPPSVFKELDLYQPGWFETMVFSLLTNPTWKAGPMAQLLTTPGLRQKLRFVGRIIFPSPEYMMARYDIGAPKLLPHFYVRRLLGALKQGIRALLPLMQANPPRQN